MPLEAKNNGSTIDAEMPVRHLIVQAVMKMHLSQPIGAGAFDGQHGMPAVVMSAIVASFAISAVVNGADISCAIVCIDASDDVPAIAGPDNGANVTPAIIRIASSRRMVILRYTPVKSHRTPRIESHSR